MAEIENYSGNSHKQKETSLIRPISSLDTGTVNQVSTDGNKQKETQKIIKGKVETRKQSASKKLVHAIVGDDIPDVKEHIVWDVIIPAIRDTIRNSLINVIESIFGGGIRRPNGSNSFVSYRNYNSIYNNGSNMHGSGGINNRSLYDYDEVVFENRGEAEEVLTQLRYSIDRYGYVSILDYYDMVGVRTRPSDANYGWINLNNAGVERVNGGYLLRLPKAMPID